MTTVRRIAMSAGRAANLGSALRGPAYEFVPAVSRDKGEIMDVTLKNFFTIEPHSRALGLNPEKETDFIDWVVSKSLMYPHSYKIVYKESGNLIGIRLMSEWDRSNKDDGWDLIDFDKLDDNTRILARILYKLQTEFWRLRPEAHKVIRREMTFVHPDHQRRGIAQHVLHLGLDFDALRAKGFAGLTSEASSIANQTLLSKNGYEELARSTAEDYTRSNGEPIVFPDATSAIKLFYRDLNKAARA